MYVKIVENVNCKNKNFACCNVSTIFTVKLQLQTTLWSYQKALFMEVIPGNILSLCLLEVRTILTKISKLKGCESLNEWIKPCENHLYWCATSTVCGTGKIIWAKFKSFLRHIVNKHENLDDPLYNKCGHGSSINQRKWFLPIKAMFFIYRKSCEQWVFLFS